MQGSSSGIAARIPFRNGSTDVLFYISLTSHRHDLFIL